MAAPCSPDPELNIPALHSSVSPHRKAINHSFLPGFLPHSSPSLWLGVIMSGMPPRLESPNFTDSWVVDSYHSSQVKVGGLSLGFCHLVGSYLESSCPAMQLIMVYGNNSRKLTPGASVCIQHPWSNAWAHCCTQAPMFFLWPGGSWDHTVSPGIPPIFATWVRRDTFQAGTFPTGTEF